VIISPNFLGPLEENSCKRTNARNTNIETRISESTYGLIDAAAHSEHGQLI
jgi:uncharacterized protein (DUF1778 family)